MIFHGKNALPRAALTSALTMSLGLSQAVPAAEGSGEMDVNAGLTQALSVTCTALNFGTTSIVEGTRAGGGTVVTLAATDGALTSTGSTAFALDNDSAATHGVCTISGSGSNTNSFNADITTSVDLSAATGETGPDTALTDLTVDTFTTDGGANDGSGGSTINIGGNLTIPDGLLSANMGDYTGTVTVTVDDNG
ncbi:DUF4402 domain-containing protein [Spiribacter roseus]|uniref:DUF4402 domain-containing protein n=1 Tax=Spiribacter roseus TaxID=1855875 RepID=UPI001F2C4674|nr:DUF4402 domain-containing protein [Spiribacter roseus]